jgi:hypothetical protein
MSDKVASAERDNRNGRFVKGCKPGPGRPVGSIRQDLAADFLRDAHQVWQEKGIASLRMTAELEPARFCQIISAILPKDIAITADHRVQIAISALEAYRLLKSSPATEIKALPVIDADT